MFLPVTMELLRGFWETVKIFFLTLAFSLPLGLVVAFGSMSRFCPLKRLTQGFVWIIRGTPLMLQLIVVYFGPSLLFGARVPGNWRFISAITAFVINYAAYFAEIYRGGIESIPRGQYEAAQVLCYTKGQTFFHIILPQVVKRIMPSITNEVVTLVKDTSLARIIALQEIIWAGQSFMKGSQGISGAIWPLFFTAIYYLIFNGILTVLLGRLERKLDYFH